MRARTRLHGLLALLVLAAILAGLPAVLIALGGNPLPATLPTLDQVRTALLAPDDGTLVLAAAQLLGWVVWAVLALTLLVEIASQVRGLPAPHLPGLRLPQTTLRPLVSTALALFLAAPGAVALTPAAAAPPASTAPASTSATTPPAPPAQPPTPAPQPGAPDRPADTGTDSTYLVRPGDTLWSIAQQHLGSGHQFGQIVHANPDVLTHGADWITPGMRLRIPHEPTATGTVTVAPGDTLSGLATQHLHDPSRWPELYQATTGITQPDGRHLTDPDLIHPGWLIHLPTADHTQDPAAESAPTGAAEPAETPATPGPPAAPRPPATPEGQAPHDAAADPPAPTLTGSARAAAQAGSRVGSTPAAGHLAPDTGQGRAPVAQPADDTVKVPDWVLPGLTASGALLGGGLFLALTARRRAASRHRRPGRTLHPPAPGLIPVEKTVQCHGADAAPDVEHLDEVLRRLGGSCHRTGTPVPPLAAIELHADALVLHMAAPATLRPPWEGSQDQLSWRLPTPIPLDQLGPLDPDGPAPYPLLVSFGTADDGTSWLLNLEGHHVHLDGDTVYLHDLARHLAAQVALHPWATGVRLACVGIAEEVVEMNPARLRTAGPDAVDEALADAVQTTGRLDPTLDVPTARMRRAGEDLWLARLLLLHTSHADHPATTHLHQLLGDHPGRTGTALVTVGAAPAGPDALQVSVSSEGRLHVPAHGLHLTGVGLTADEARGCAALLAQAGDPTDAPMPDPAPVDAQADPWRAWADQAGGLRPEHTRDRDVAEPQAETTTLLPESDPEYLTAAATTTQDLQTLAPRVATDVTAEVLHTDPDLDDDLAAWWDPEARLPKLTLLGPVTAKTWGKPLVDRKAYFTELLAYLALHPAGSTPADTADAFDISNDKCRDYIARCREWLGTHPHTGTLHLPRAPEAPATQARGVNVYQVLDVLVDIDLFRRLRTRAAARGGEAGIADLRAALQLVQGRPFDQLRRQGWAWLFDGDRIDQHMVCAIVDVAHTIATHDLQTGNLPGARAAAQTATLAAPDEQIPALDLVAVLHAEGHELQATQLLRDIGNRPDDLDDAPGEFPSRTHQILDARSWLDHRRAG